jgi:hypothetical protein
VALHTRTALTPHIIDRANRDHPYEVPVIAAITDERALYRAPEPAMITPRTAGAQPAPKPCVSNTRSTAAGGTRTGAMSSAARTAGPRGLAGGGTDR